MEQCLDVTTVNQSIMCPTYCRTDGWHVFCLNKRKKIQLNFYHAVCLCKPSLFTAESFPSNHTYTHIQGSSSLLKEWRVYGHKFTACWGRRLQAELWAKEVSQRDTWSLFHQSDLLGFCFIYQQPPHLYYEYFCLFIENLDTNRPVRQTAQ